MFTISKYVKAQSLKEAYDLNQSKTSIVLGGMMWLRLSNRSLQTAIDLSDLGLDMIEEKDDEFSIGAMVTLRQLEKHQSLNTFFDGAVRDAVKDIVGVQFRNGATVGGSLFGRFGFSDVLSVFLSMDSYVELYSKGIIPLCDFVKMPRDNDILVRLIIKKSPCLIKYQAMRVQSTDFPVLTCAVSKTGDLYKVVLGARPMAAELVCDENSILAKDINDEVCEEFSQYAVSKLKFGSNNRGSEEYRKHLAKVLISRGLNYIKEKEEA